MRAEERDTERDSPIIAARNRLSGCKKVQPGPGGSAVGRFCSREVRSVGFAEQEL